ncbi:dTDP-glucose 4,6-dehydratase [Maricaulaceae bacterium MS644]
MKPILVTGGVGFIGGTFVRRARAQGRHVINLDALTYASSPAALAGLKDPDNYTFVHGDICDQPLIEILLSRYQPGAIVHFAAETHVDRSIDSSAIFLRTNVEGTHRLLEATTTFLRNSPDGDRNEFRFLHVSTDEVYGSLGPTGMFSEATPYDPRSPYSASKAASDHLVRAWRHTHGLPTMVANTTNNFGPFQFPEKLIPLTVVSALRGGPLRVYGRGENIRDWIYVEDHCEGLEAVLARGIPGETYCLGGRSERKNIDVVLSICRLLDELSPRADGRAHEVAIEFVGDRPGHDFRYAMDTSKAERELGWAPQTSFEVGLRRTIKWYIENERWWDAILNGDYQGERLGLGKAAS